MIRIAAIALFVTASSALAAPVISLAPAGGQDLRQPFREVKFTAQNTTAGIVRAVSFRSRDGGPTLLVDAVIPPGGKLEGVVPLPALLPQQSYDVMLLSSVQAAADESAPQVLLKSQADVFWPPAMVNPDRFVNWRYDQAQFGAVAWPAERKRDVLLVLVLGCLAMAAVRLLGDGKRGQVPFSVCRPHEGKAPVKKKVPDPFSRWLALGAIVAGTTVASAWVLGRVGLAVNQSSWVSIGERTQPLLAAGSRRTIQAVYNPRIVPVYVTREQMQNDSTVIHVAREATMTLRPGSVYLFEQPEEKALVVSP